ncbi:MAG: DUF4870 domain-containing protein [Xanthomonadales bacterium]|nr:DUF4870 domain-containing protein [Xanthomonadales bacterium]
MKRGKGDEAWVSSFFVFLLSLSLSLSLGVFFLFSSSLSRLFLSPIFNTRYTFEGCLPERELTTNNTGNKREHEMSEIGPGPEENRTDQEIPEVVNNGKTAVEERDRETNQWAMFIHFSILAGWVVPIGGLIVPIILWQMKKDELPGTVPHAHIVLNWIVSSLVYAVICFILTFILIGLLGFIALAILTIAYAVIGGLKANEGIIWEYPGTIIKVFK